jgi:queuine/archaeosine tRNA-ribosyltransferase
MPAKKEDTLRTDRRKEEGESLVTLHIPKAMRKEIKTYRMAIPKGSRPELSSVDLSIYTLGWKHFKK